MLKAINIRLEEIQNGEALQAIAEAGFDGIDLGISRMGEEKRKEFLANVEKYAKIIEESGLSCVQVHLPYGNMFLSSEIEDKDTDESNYAAFVLMERLGCKWGAYHPRHSTGFGYDAARAMEDNRRVLTNYLERAVKHGVGIAVENIPIFPDCPQYRFFTADPEDHIELVDSLGSDSVAVCWDFGHANLMPYDMCKVIRKMGSRIKILHVHDNFRTGDLHLCPSVGTIDWDKVLPTLRESGYEGDISLEVNSPMSETKRSFYAHCYDTATALLEKYYK